MTSPTRLATAVIFFFSGFAALVYQVAWQRVLTQEIGVDTVSVAFIVTIFMIGLGFGALAGGRWTRRGRNLAASYAVIELLIGLWGLISVPLLRFANERLALVPVDSILLDFAVNCLVLAPPIFLMGMTSPIIMELMKDSLARWGRVVGVFYGLNVLGAAVGALVCGLALIELLGLRGTTWLAAGINCAIGAMFWMMRGRLAATAAASASATSRDDRPRRDLAAAPSSRLGLNISIACVLLGFSTLAVQMIFFRVLANYFTLSAMVFPIMLAAYLLLMSAGQVFSGWAMDRLRPARHGDFLLALLAGACVTTIVAFAINPGALAGLGVLVFSPSVSGMNLGVEATFGDPAPLRAFIFALLFMLPVLFLSGFFPAVVKMATRDINEAGHVFGKVLFWFTLGNVIGTFLTAITMFEHFGTIVTLFITLGLAALGIVAMAGAVRLGALLLTRAAVAAVLVVAVVFMVPRDYYMRFGAGEYKPTDIIEGHTGVLTVVPTQRFYTLLDMFRTESASAIHTLPDEGAAYELWRWNMSDLLALDSEFRPARILIIGIGHGYLARALLDYDFVKEVVIVELSPEVLDGVHKHSHPEIQAIYQHPKVKMVIDDGRRFVTKALARGEQYDLIQNRINEPWRAGSSSLFTTEFFRDLKGLLKPGGYLATRQMIGYAVEGLQVFDRAYWPGWYHIYFTDKTLAIPDVITIGVDLAPLYLAQKPGMVIDRLPEARSRLRVAMLTRGDVEGYQLNTDDHPTLEYRFIENRRQRWKDPKIFLDKLDLASVTRDLPVRLTSAVEGSITSSAP